MKEADREEARRWLETLMPLCEQASIFIHSVTDKVNADGLPTDLTALPEAILKLSPVLKSVREMPKPRNRELRLLRKDLKLTLDACIKASKWRIKHSRKASRIRLSATVFWTSLAISFSESLACKLALLPGYGGEA
ncbi:hypothetical protein ACFLUX_03100 [Chloroflexota bacterium]